MLQATAPYVACEREIPVLCDGPLDRHREDTGLSAVTTSVYLSIVYKFVELVA